MNIVYAPNSNTIENLQLNIFIPYTDIQSATLISLIGYNYMPIKMEGDYGYSEYFKKRWEDKDTFINIEHDIVVYPGALQALWDCPEEWCVYDYHLPNHWIRNLENEVNGIPLGCIKISKEMIEKTPNLWDEPILWNKCDQHLTKYLTKSGLKVHQHSPGVVNANKDLLGFVNLGDLGGEK